MFTLRKEILGLLFFAVCQTFFTQRYEVNMLDIGKGSEQVFAGDIYNGRLYYCSNQKNKKAKHVVNEDKSRFLDLFYQPINSDLAIDSSPVRLGNSVNSPLNEGPIYFDRSTKAAYFSSNLVDTGFLTLKIFQTTALKDTFSQRQMLEFDLATGNYSNPTVSPDGQYMIFSYQAFEDSTSDLYISKKTGNSWEEPFPLTSLNTPYNESFPRWNENTLHFASDRPNGTGGLDLYKSKFESNHFTEPAKLPEPLNSVWDDFLFIQTSPGKGILSSNRWKGRDRIFAYSLDLPLPDSYESTEINYCYTLQDETIQNRDQYDYIWELGDGTKKNGSIIDHCYKDTGVYHISCHLMNTTTLVVEKDIIDGDIVVGSELPIVNYVKKENSITLSLDQTKSQKKFDQYYWIIGNEPFLEKDLTISTNKMKQIEVLVVLWNENDANNIYGIKKQILLTE